NILCSYLYHTHRTRASFPTLRTSDLRQELIVEAALTGRREPARAAMMTDPLICDPATVDSMLDELMASNAEFVGSDLGAGGRRRSEEHTSELQSRGHLVCRLLIEIKK